MKYRPDIDGLRAIAVILVVAFHAEAALMPAGFIGVDVFFVVSGYLITGIIASDLRRGTFSFRSFYASRIRRIFPALVVMLAAVFAVGLVCLLAGELQQLGKHTAAGALFISNFMFWRETGYFDVAAETKPLLHLWSLAIEEQFYLLWPVAMWFAWRRGYSIVGVTLSVVVISFACNVALMHAGSQPAAYFFPISRFWELMVGSLLALMPPNFSGGLAKTASWSGAVLLAISGVVIDRATFPGWWALMPVMATAAIISAGTEGPINRLLSYRGVVAIGLISYPLYLWHWPLLSLARIVEGETPSLATRAVLVCIAFLLALMTYRYVERPLRSETLAPVNVAAVAMVALFTVGVSGLGMMLVQGFPTLHTVAKAGAIVQENGNDIFYRYQTEHFFPCTPASLRLNAPSEFGSARCLQSKQSNSNTLAIIGDSHAEDLFPGLSERFADIGIVKYIRGPLPVRANSEYTDILNYVESDPRIKIVIFASAWSLHSKEWTPESRHLNELTETVQPLIAAGKTVYLVTERPTFTFDPSICKYYRQRLALQPGPRCEMRRPNFTSDLVLKAVAIRAPGVRIVDGAGPFCDETQCLMARDHTMMFRDPSHLTLEGSRVVASTFDFIPRAAP